MVLPASRVTVTVWPLALVTAPERVRGAAISLRLRLPVAVGALRVIVGLAAVIVMLEVAGAERLLRAPPSFVTQLIVRLAELKVELLEREL